MPVLGWAVLGWLVPVALSLKYLAGVRADPWKSRTQSTALQE